MAPCRRKGRGERFVAQKLVSASDTAKLELVRCRPRPHLALYLIQIFITRGRCEFKSWIGWRQCDSMLCVPGDGNKRDPERENWPCRVMLPILPIQSISGSRLLPSPGTEIG